MVFINLLETAGMFIKDERCGFRRKSFAVFGYNCRKMVMLCEFQRHKLCVLILKLGCMNQKYV